MHRPESEPSAPSRRQFLIRAGASALAPAFFAACTGTGPREYRGRGRRRGAATGPGGAAGPLDGVGPLEPAEPMVPPPSPRMEALIELLRETPRDEVFAAALRATGDYRELLRAVWLAGVRGVRPRPVGFKLHAVMMVPAALDLAELTPPRERMLPVLFNLDDYKRAQALDDRQAGGWDLPPRPEVAADADEARRLDVRAARESLARALRENDDERAQARASELSGRVPLDELFELLWPAAIRDYASLGHKAIFADHALRALLELGPVDPDPVLRALVHGLTDTGPGPRTDAFERNVESAASLRDGWSDGEPAPEATAVLLAELRACTSEQAADATVNFLNNRVAPSSVFDAVVLAGSEVLMNRPGVLAVHAVTVSHALRSVFERSTSDRTRRLAVLQAAAWLPLFRDEVAARDPRPSPGRKIDDLQLLPQARAMALEQILRDMDKSRSDGASLLFTLAEAGRAPDAVDGLRRVLFEKGVDHHQYKYAAAMVRETRAVHPRWSAHVLAASAHYLPTVGESESPVHARAVRALA